MINGLRMSAAGRELSDDGILSGFLVCVVVDGPGIKVLVDY